jgi:hypothetical protein
LEASVANTTVPARADRREYFLLAIMLLLFVAYNFATSTRFPLPWQDEDMFTDVAANFALGNGFTSSVWTCGDHQTSSFFACNTPLYPFVSGLWIKIFGFTILGVRSLNYILMALSCWVLWLAVRRLGWIENPMHRLLFIPLVLMGYGVGINFRSGRYDCLSILLCSSIMLASTLRSRPLRCALIALGGIILPFSGLQLLPLALIFSVCLVLIYRWTVLPECLALCAGAAVGGVALLGLYHHFGVLNNFFDSLRTESPTSFKDRFIDDEDRTKRLPKDPSLFLLYGALLVISIQQMVRGKFRLRSALGFGLVAGTLVPVSMMLISKFTTYYTWMACIPICIGIASAISCIDLRRRSFWSSAVALLLVGACLLGLPLQAASAIYYWHDRDTEPVEALVSRQVNSSDWVFADFAAYFAVRKKTQHVFIPFIVPSQYQNKISVMILAPGEYERYAHARIGGDWYDTGERLSSSGHDLVERSFAVLLQRRNDMRVYKRLPAPANVVTIEPVPKTTQSGE